MSDPFTSPAPKRAQTLTREELIGTEPPLLRASKESYISRGDSEPRVSKEVDVEVTLSACEGLESRLRLQGENKLRESKRVPEIDEEKKFFANSIEAREAAEAARRKNQEEFEEVCRAGGITPEMYYEHVRAKYYKSA